MPSLGRGGGLVVSVLAFYSDDLIRTPLKSTVYPEKFVFLKKLSSPTSPGVEEEAPMSIAFDNCSQ